MSGLAEGWSWSKTVRAPEITTARASTFTFAHEHLRRRRRQADGRARRYLAHGFAAQTKTRGGQSIGVEIGQLDRRQAIVGVGYPGDERGAGASTGTVDGGRGARVKAKVASGCDALDRPAPEVEPGSTSRRRSRGSVPEPQGCLEPKTPVRPRNGGPSAAAAREAAGVVDEPSGVKVIAGGPPVHVPEPVDHDTAICQPERDRSVGGAVAGGGNAGARAAGVEVAAQGGRDSVQGHGRLRSTRGP